METMSIKLPKELKARIRATARVRKTRPSALVREAIEQSLNGKGAKPSLYELDRDVLEIPDDSGPRDLSTNPKYMKNYGK